MRPVLDFKWRNFARRRLYLIWILFLAYYITFWIACSWDEMPTTARINMLRSALVLAVILIWMELRQLIGEGWRYVLSIYNWFGRLRDDLGDIKSRYLVASLIYFHILIFVTPSWCRYRFGSVRPAVCDHHANFNQRDW